MWVPAVNVDVLKVAVWPAPSVPLPSVVEPSRKLTEPLGVPASEVLTVAVNVTDWPALTVPAEDVTTAVVAPLLMVTDTAADVDAGKALSPA